MLHQYLEQEQIIAQAIDKRNEQADKKCSLATKGRLDALTGAEADPELITEQWYWQGYCSGMKDYYYKKYEVQVEQEF